MDISYKLYLITDRSFLNNRSLAECVEDAIKGGVTLVQVREKNISTRDFYNIAREVQKVTTKYNVPLLINDRIDIALAINADGVHLGQSDMPMKLARKILGKDKIIGVSAANVEEAIEAEKAGADYVGLGAVFFTGTKKDITEPIGLTGLREITKNITIPSVAIGGINKENAKSVLATGVDGISVISSILKNDDIQNSSKTLANV